MAQSNKVIITCAVTGAIHTPSMSPYLPVTADQIAEAAIGAAEAGAAIVHLIALSLQVGAFILGWLTGYKKSSQAHGWNVPKINQKNDTDKPPRHQPWFMP